MTSNLVPFMFGENHVRARVDENGNPWFVAKDVASVLGIQNIRQNLDELDEDEKGVSIVYTLGGQQQMSTISESGLYALVFRSRKPQARAFSKWVRAEVLPALRREGRYEMPGHPSGHARHDMPEGLPEEALCLRPALRQRLWQDALQTARLDGKGSEEARQWFAYLCRMAAAKPPVTNPVREKVRAFFMECCEYDAESRVSFGELYVALCRWHRGRDGRQPSKRAFGEYLQELVPRLRSNGSHYEGIRLKKSKRKAA
jgi:prophage antirepressor-like protein